MEPVLVESPGRWNLESGPDFLDAVLLIGSERRRVTGDVEVHVHPGDWSTHGHSATHSYDKVVAHVTYFPGSRPPGLPPGAVSIAMAKALGANPGFSFDSLDLSAYPYACATKPVPPCRIALERMGPEAAGTLLESAGEERIRRKAERIFAAGSLAGREQALYEEIACALGYKHNRAPFRRLARAVTADTLRSASGGDSRFAYALLLGVSGLMPANPAPDWDDETKSFVREMWDTWWKLRGRWQTRCLTPDSWRLSGVRPSNHPARRMAALAALFADGSSLVDRLNRAVEPGPPAAPRTLSSILSQGARFPYWDRRVAWGARPGRGRLALIGPDRMAAVITNVVAPFLQAAGHDVSGLLRRLPREQDNATTRRMAHLLLGRDHNPSTVSAALRHQGLLQISEDFCTVSRGGCSECSLPAALEAAPGDLGRG
jgi:hypothetical protein